MSKSYQRSSATTLAGSPLPPPARGGEPLAGTWYDRTQQIAGPLLHAASKAVRQVFYEGFALFVAAYRTAAEKPARRWCQAPSKAGHPKVGASWEGFLVKEIVERLNARTEECFFWATHSGAKLDLLIVSGQRRLGFEVKRTTAPRLTRSMAAVLADLDLERLDVIHAGERTFSLARNVRAVAASGLLDEIEPLRRP